MEIQATSRTTSPQVPRIAWRLFLTAWILFSAHLATNIVREHYPAFSLAEHGTFRVDEYAGFHSDIFVHTDGHAYIGNNVATSVIAAVPLWLCDPVLDALSAHSLSKRSAGGPRPPADYRTDKPNRREFYQKIVERGLELRFAAAAIITTVLLMAPLSALMVLSMYRLLVARGATTGCAIGLALLLGFGTPICFRTAHLNNNMFVMYATWASFWLLWNPLANADPPGSGRKFVAGLFAGFALAADYSGLVALVCLFAYLVAKRLRSVGIRGAVVESIPFVLGSVPPVLFLLYSQWSMYGHPLLPGQYWMPEVNYTERGWRGFSLPSPDLFALNLLHPSYGMYAFAPLLLLGLLPAPRNPARPLLLPRPERRFVALFVLAFLLFCAANQYSRMQWNTGFRYLLPLVPLVFLAGCDHLVRMPRTVAILIAGIAVIHSTVLCLARDVAPPGDTWRYASSVVSWIGGLGEETVPASYVRLWREGLQFNWLRVLCQVLPQDHPLVLAWWLPWAVVTVCAILIGAIWSVGGRRAAQT